MKLKLKKIFIILINSYPAETIMASKLRDLKIELARLEKTLYDVDYYLTKATTKLKIGQLERQIKEEEVEYEKYLKKREYDEYVDENSFPAISTSGPTTREIIAEAHRNRLEEYIESFETPVRLDVDGDTILVRNAQNERLLLVVPGDFEEYTSKFRTMDIVDLRPRASE